jgi:small subunit ribosomal protein S19
MSRSLWKGPFVDNYLFKKSNKILNTKASVQLPKVTSGFQALSVSGSESKEALLRSSRNTQCIRVWSRRSFILPEFIDQFFEIYNGKQFISFQVNEDMVGHKFGEFASTRKKTLHKKKIKGKGS